MAKTAFSPQQQIRIRQAKALLRTLLKQSQLQQKTVLAALEQAGLTIKKNTLSSWFSETDLKRPDRHYLLPLIHILSPHHSTQEIQHNYQTTAQLLGYDQGPESSEAILNQLSIYLNERLEHRLNQQYQEIENSLSPLIDLLENLQGHIFEYDKGYPVIRIAQDDKTLLHKVFGKSKTACSPYHIKGGYEIPLSQLPSLEIITQIVNLLHEATRSLRAYVERCLLRQESLSLPAFEELLDYIWEIVNRLLFNPVAQESPALKKALLTVITATWGIKYLRQSLSGQSSGLIAFQNILERKGMESKAEIQCSIAVYVGTLARLLLNSARKTDSKLEYQQGWQLFEQARSMLINHHEALPLERDIYYYKKEIANLAYDIATLLLWHQATLPDFQTKFQSLIQEAYAYYQAVLETVNLFQSGLSESRATHIRTFYTLAACWLQPCENAVTQINLLHAGQQFNEIFWLVQMAKALGFGILVLRSKDPKDKISYQQAAQACLERARLVPGMATETAKELEQDYVLQKIFNPA